MMQFLLLAALALPVVLVKAGTSTSTTNTSSSCVVTADLATAIYDSLDGYLQPSISALNIIATTLTYDVNQTLWEIPVPGAMSASMVQTINASTTRQILWSLYGQVPNVLTNGLAPNVQISSIDGYMIDYGYSSTRVTNGQGDGTALVISPESTTLTVASDGGYCSCPNTQYFFYVNSKSGVMTTQTYFTTASLNTCQKYWYWPALQTSNIIWSYPYFGSTTNSLIYAIAKQYTTMTSSGPKTGVIEVSVVLSFLSSFISSINTQAATQVGYIMTSKNPVGLLVATTTGQALNTTTYATSSPNSIIKSTSKYIFNNGITADTAGYVSSLGCYLSVRYYTSPNGADVTLTAPSEYNIMPATEQANWIVVSCNTESNPQTSYTTTTTADDDSVNGQTGGAILGLAVVVLVIVVLLFALVAFHMSRKPTIPLAQQAQASAPEIELKTAV